MFVLTENPTGKRGYYILESTQGSKHSAVCEIITLIISGQTDIYSTVPSETIHSCPLLTRLWFHLRLLNVFNVSQGFTVNFRNTSVQVRPTDIEKKVYVIYQDDLNFV